MVLQPFSVNGMILGYFGAVLFPRKALEHLKSRILTVPDKDTNPARMGKIRVQDLKG